MDVHTRENRSYNMSQIKGKNTKPEEFQKEPWLEIVDGTELLSRIINTMNHNDSIAPLIDEKSEVASYVDEVKLKLSKK